MRRTGCLVVVLVIALASTVAAQTINLSGNVVDTTGAPIASVTVRLQTADTLTWTDSLGRFAIVRGATQAMRQALPAAAGSAVMTDHTLRFALDNDERVTVELFDLAGRRVRTFLDGRLRQGRYALDVLPAEAAQALYTVRLTVGGRAATFALLRTDRGDRPRALSNRTSSERGPGLARRLASVDSLVVSKMRYNTVKIGLDTYSGNYPNIVLHVDAIEWRVDSLLRLMTLDEKIGQMVQAECDLVRGNNDIQTYFLGSVLSANFAHTRDPSGWADISDGVQAKAAATRLGIPLIYGVDAVHGDNQVNGGVIFPHNVGMGCTRNPALVEQEWRVTAQETNGTGCNWTFGPCIAVPRDERWGRTYEGFGETGELAALMAPAAVRGLQTANFAASGSIAACAKHYAADGGTLWGTGVGSSIDRGDARCDTATLFAVHLAGYLAAAREGLATVMASYSSWQGTWMHGHHYLITDVLKRQFGFEGFVITDYNGVSTIQLPAITDPQAKFREQLRLGAVAGVDMFMSPGNHDTVFNELKAHVSAGNITQARVNDAVCRILGVKYRMGLFQRRTTDRALTAQIGSAAHRAVARECVRQSLVLLKNQNSRLPLSKNGQRIAVVGLHADSLALQCGGWTMGWMTGNPTAGTTILDAISATVTTPSNVTYSANGRNIASADVAVVVTGETSYAEWFGDVPSGIPSLDLPRQSKAFIDTCVAAGKPVVLVIISGRPLILGTYIDKCDAIVAAWLPGTEGQGVADVLFGDYHPTGTLGHSWPRTQAQIPINYGDAVYDPQWPYGYGLTY
jgi:beta-glucosidase